MLIKSNLRVLMAESEMNIKDVHEATGLSRTTISKLFNNESTTVSFETIETLCTLFDCGIEDLLKLQKGEKKKGKV